LFVYFSPLMCFLPVISCSLSLALYCVCPWCNIICYNCYYYYYYYYYHYFIVCLFVFCLRFRINMYFLQCLPVIYIWLCVVLLHNVITYMYTVLCL
jgi:hypothetical protein